MKKHAAIATDLQILKRNLAHFYFKPWICVCSNQDIITFPCLVSKMSELHEDSYTVLQIKAKFIKSYGKK